MFKPRTRLWLALLLTAFAAFALRLYRIQTQSLWYDEAFSIYLARMDLGAITARTAADIQPPLYYYLLHLWMGLTGDSELAARFLSLVPGVLSIPLLYVTARRLFNRAAGLLAALLAVLSPLYLWYSQEARMYSLITFLGLLSSYALLRAIASKGMRLSRVEQLRPSPPAPAPSGSGGERNSGEMAGVSPLPSPRTPKSNDPREKVGDSRSPRGGQEKGWNSSRNWWIVFTLANAAAVYTHYFAFALIAFQLIYALWVAVSRRSRTIALRAGAAFGAVLVAFLPWAPFMLNRLGEDASYWRGALKVDEAIRHVFINFTMGESVLEDTARVLAAAWLVVLIAGLAAWLLARRRGSLTRSPYALAFAVLYLVVPLALLLILFYRNPKFNARYLMIASPALVLLLAAGLAGLVALVRGSGRLGRAIAALMLLLAAGTLFGTSLYADSNLYFDPAFTKADFRGVAQYVAAHATSDEAIVLVSGHLFPAFDYYYRAGGLPELRLPDDATLNAEHVLDYSAADELNRGAAGKKGVWLVEWQDEVVDPNGFVPLLLSSRGQEQKLDASFWQVRLRHWVLPAETRFSDQPEVAVKREANFKNKVELLGLSQPAPAPADSGAAFNLYWKALDTLTEDYQVSLRVVDAQGNLWGKQDRRPAGYNYPATRWKKGENLFGAYSVPLLPGTPAGDYFVTATIFTTADQTGLDVLAPNGAPIGRTVKLGPVHVLPAQKQPGVLDLKIQHTLNLKDGPFTLLGYNLSREKASTGESIPLTAFWRADRAPQADYQFQVQFGDRASAARPLANAAHPTSAWSAGELVRGQYLVQVPPDAAAGQAGLKLNLIGPEGETLDLLQPFAVEKVDRVFVQPDSQYKQAANFGNVIGLAGYSFSAPQIQPGGTLTVTLILKGLGKMDKRYTAFVHVLDKGSQVAGQKDAEPLGGNRATPSWVEGEYLTDSFPVTVKPEAAPGEYRVEIGWYDAADPAYARLQVLDANGAAAGDNVILDQKVTIGAGQ